MARCKIIRTPDERLRKASLPATAFDEFLGKLVQDMIDTMEAANGAGLAAIQIGEPLRVVVIDGATSNRQSVGIPGSAKPIPLVLVNPEITWRSDEAEVAVEGCLSFPGIVVRAPRSVGVRVKHCDALGTPFEFETHDPWFARALQHELDHLDGRLLVDLAPPLSLDALKRT